MFDVKKQKTARQQQVAAKDNPKTKAFQLCEVVDADALVVHMGGREGGREGRKEGVREESLTYWETANHDQI
jgi:hypothetical protein